jgi:hypothetical protein
VNTQNRLAVMASATRTATAAGAIPSSIARCTCGPVTPAVAARGGTAPRPGDQLRPAWAMLVRTQPGHKTLTPAGSMATLIAWYRSSEIATTACLAAS